MDKNLQVVFIEEAFCLGRPLIVLGPRRPRLCFDARFWKSDAALKTLIIKRKELCFGRSMADSQDVLPQDPKLVLAQKVFSWLTFLLNIEMLIRVVLVLIEGAWLFWSWL